MPVEIDGTVHQVYVLKRPHVDEFLQRMGELYECVLFTASLAKVFNFVHKYLVMFQQTTELVQKCLKVDTYVETI